MLASVRPPCFFPSEGFRSGDEAGSSISLMERVAKAGAACYGSGEAEVTLS